MKRSGVQRTKFVDHIPDLIHPEDYASDPEGEHLRIEIRTSEEGVQILGDAQRPALIDDLLSELEAVEIGQMLCG